MTATLTTHGARSRLPIRLVILFAGIATILLVWLYRDALHGWVLVRGTLANNAPTLELFEEYLRRSPESSAALLDAWNSGKIVHRQFAIRQLSAGDVNGKSLSPELEGMLLSGALDPDMNVRESALQGLRRHRHQALPALAAAQLQDPDPELRLLGLDHLKHAPPELGIAQIAPLFGDPDPRVAARAIKLLEQWSGQDFDVKLADAVEVTDHDTGLKGFRPEGIARVRAASARAQEWISRHSDYSAIRLEPPPLALAGLQPIPAGDFILPTLEGRKVRLSDFRGQPVLINFWTTWCTACLAEIDQLPTHTTAPMNIEEAKLILSAYRPDGQDAGDPQFQEALELMKHDPELDRWFAEAQAWDTRVADKLRQAASTPPELKSELLAQRYRTVC
jgi:thiol-disulfide isomerase/thioredoxin